MTDNAKVATVLFFLFSPEEYPVPPGVRRLRHHDLPSLRSVVHALHRPGRAAAPGALGLCSWFNASVNQQFVLSPLCSVFNCILIESHGSHAFRTKMATQMHENHEFLRSQCIQNSNL